MLIDLELNLDEHPGFIALLRGDHEAVEAVGGLLDRLGAKDVMRRRRRIESSQIKRQGGPASENMQPEKLLAFSPLAAVMFKLSLNVGEGIFHGRSRA